FHLSAAKVQKGKAQRTTHRVSPATTTTSVAPSFKLPEINVPIFTGNIIDFQSFWDLFINVADQVNGSDVQKFSYIMTRLRGEPLDLIKNLRLTSDNYAAAKRLLQQRHGDKSIIERTVRSNLFALTACRNREEVRDF